MVYVPGPLSGSSPRGDLAFVDRSGAIEQLKVPSLLYERPRVSPDGTRVALGSGDATAANIWIYELSGASAIRQLTFGGQNRFPLWTADSQRIVFQSDREGDLGIFWQRADGTDTPRRLTRPENGASHVPESWSRTEERLLFGSSTGSAFSLWTLSLPEGKLEPVHDVRSGGVPLNAVWSHDGRWIAYSVREGKGTIGIFVEPFPVTGAKYRVANGIFPVWSPDGKELFYMGVAGTLYVTRVSIERGFGFTEPARIPIERRFSAGPTSGRAYDIMPDGRRLIAIVPPGEEQAALPQQIEVVLNWFEDLKRQVPGAK